MSEQAIIPEANRRHYVADLHADESMRIDPGWLLTNKYNQVMVPGMAQGNTGDKNECVVVKKGMGGVNLDLSACDKEQLSIEAMDTRTVEQIIGSKGLLPALSLSFGDEAAQAQGPNISNPAYRTREDAQHSPQYKTGNLTDFQRGESAYVAPNSLFLTQGGKAWMEANDSKASGRKTDSKCVRVDLQEDGVKVDVGACANKHFLELDESAETAGSHAYMVKQIDGL